MERPRADAAFESDGGERAPLLHPRLRQLPQTPCGRFAHRGPRHAGLLMDRKRRLSPFGWRKSLASKALDGSPTVRFSPLDLHAD